MIDGVSAQVLRDNRRAGMTREALKLLFHRTASNILPAGSNGFLVHSLCCVPPEKLWVHIFRLFYFVNLTPFATRPTHAANLRAAKI
eukprot:1054831-Prorocentrum_minimum.AAC.2